MLLCSVKACRTVSSAALRAVTGTATLSLEILKTAAKFHIRKNINFQVGDYHFYEHESLNDYNIHNEYKKLSTEIAIWLSRAGTLQKAEKTIEDL